MVFSLVSKVSISPNTLLFPNCNGSSSIVERGAVTASVGVESENEDGFACTGAVVLLFCSSLAFLPKVITCDDFSSISS